MRNNEEKTKNFIDIIQEHSKVKIFEQKWSRIACLKVNANTVQWKRYDSKSKANI
jgi:hypothetical protein